MNCYYQKVYSQMRRLENIFEIRNEAIFFKVLHTSII